jgi:ATP-binding cassette subfamily F protein uup
LLDNVVTSCLVFEGEGQVNEYVGGYADWLRQRKLPEPKPGRLEARRASDPAPAGNPPNRSPGKLSYKDQRELDGLPTRIEALEAEQETLHAQLADPAFYQQEGEAIAAATLRLEQVARQLEQDYARWEALEARKGG